uniref:AlNc14C366G11058 protein n=1 Tax=Albugo laibachii Nc14 TaxID=890382 RepID=F0WXX3_9STRA|nr:AlNc14C366G11058 [Albugo laibachii Nc14]|eukprot:CCA26321.1 AlNc14C366G11058 [Albugo laibachii Nc14]
MSDHWSASLLQAAVDYLKEHKGAIDESVGHILAVLPKNDMELLVKAIHMVEKLAVTRVITSPNQRVFFQVTSAVCPRESIGASAIPERSNYINVCFEHFCTCSTYINTLIKCPAAMCEHIIAVKVALATEKFRLLQIQDTEYPSWLAQVLDG